MKKYELAKELLKAIKGYELDKKDIEKLFKRDELTENILSVNDKICNVIWYIDLDDNEEGLITEDGTIYINDDYEEVIQENGF